MRIKTDDQYEWRNNQYSEAADVLGEATKSKGIDAATAFSIAMVDNLERAIEHEDMSEELADLLSTDQVELKYHVETDVNVGD